MRALRHEDLPALVALRRAVFQHSERPDDAQLTAYMERVFLQSPWADDELPSLVYEDAEGRVGGFLGIIPRRMMFKGESLRIAVATQLMVAAELRGLVGRRLVRAYREGPQDLSLSDAANDAARRLWQSVGGDVALVHGYGWERVLRPVAQRLAGAGVGLLRPLAAAAALVVHRPQWRRLRGETRPLDPVAMAHAAPRLLKEYALRPCYDDGSFPWLLAELAEKRQFGSLEGALVCDADGVSGWFVYFLASDGCAEVVQLVARTADRERLLAHLTNHAWGRGAHTLRGRLSPDLLPVLAAARCGLQADAPCVLYSSSRLDVLRALERGDVFLSRLDGEWWLSF